MFAPVRTLQAAGKRPLMRFPDVRDGNIAFVYGEDIWTVPADGGVARRLTINDGEEEFPKYSPDGKMIAFTGEYDGNVDVYVMNRDGGNITRVTYHPDEDVVVGWHPTKNKIIFRSARHSVNSRYTHLFLVSPDGTGLEELPLHMAAQGAYSPDGAMIAYNRLAREHRTWKRYRGGMQQEVYVYDFATQKDRKITDFDGTDRIPMWIGDKIYFSSDRDGTLNIYAYDTKTSSTEQITHHKDYDVRRPSAGGDQIVYELGGELWLLDTRTGKSARVPVEIRADAAEARPYLKQVDHDITDFDCSPSGKRALVVARGEVFTVPKEHGPTRNLTNSSGARDKDAVWSPDGKTIAYLSDKSGEYEIYLVNPNGEEHAVRLTSYKDGYRHTLRWSPDSKKIAFADQTLRCYYLDVASKKITEVDHAEYENIDVSLDIKPIYDFAWSPDSRFIAYSKMNENLVYNVWVYSLDDGSIHRVSEGLFNDFGPVFSRDGEHLFFISNRRFDPTLCDFEWEMVYKRVAGVYAVTLREDGAPVMPFKSDEEGTDGKKDKEETDEKKAVKVRIDFDGLAGRIEHLPLPRGNYRSLAAGDGVLFYLDKDEGDFNRFEFRNIGPMDLHRFSFDDHEAKTVIEGVDGYRLSADGKTVVYKKDHSIGMIDAGATDSDGEALDLDGLEMRLDPLAEWNQIFNEVWRMERDFYYWPGMNGIDWNKMRERYSALMPYVSCRQDVKYVVGELIGELSTSHTYVYGGDQRREADWVNVGMLGVDWKVDPAANHYRFGKIYRVADWTHETIPPLARPGVDVHEGDYLLAVNGIDATADRNIYSYFQNLAGEQVTILVGSKPSKAGAREYTVKPLRNERTLRYLDWVEHNRMVVDKESGGEIGYIHLPDTYLGSAYEFPKYFYAQTRKKGLVIDGRFNGGGLDPDIFLERLDKKVLGYWTRRYSHDQTNPSYATRAHMVCLTNHLAGSGGDMLPMEFRLKGMGPVIGTRTWGGLVGVSMWIPLIDGGGFSAPDYRIYGADGKWVVENKGIEPDIVVDLDPAEMARGYDAQLMKAIEVLKQQIKDDPRPWPTHEPYTRQSVGN